MLQAETVCPALTGSFVSMEQDKLLLGEGGMEGFACTSYLHNLALQLELLLLGVHQLELCTRCLISQCIVLLLQGPHLQQGHAANC